MGPVSCCVGCGGYLLTRKKEREEEARTQPSSTLAVGYTSTPPVGYVEKPSVPTRTTVQVQSAASSTHELLMNYS